MSERVQRGRTKQTIIKRAMDPTALTDEAIYRNVCEYMAGIANVDDLFGHVNYFEKAVPAEITAFLRGRESEPDSEMDASRACHSFSAWIRLYAELICNKAMASLSRNELCKMGPAEYLFEQLAVRISDKAQAIAREKGIPGNRIETMIRSFKLVIQFRHCLQHGGLPRPIRKEERVPDPKDLEEAFRMSIPQNFEQTKQIFQDASELVKLLPQRTIMVSMGPKVKFR